MNNISSIRHADSHQRFILKTSFLIFSSNCPKLHLNIFFFDRTQKTGTPFYSCRYLLWHLKQGVHFWGSSDSTLFVNLNYHLFFPVYSRDFINQWIKKGDHIYKANTIDLYLTWIFFFFSKMLLDEKYILSKVFLKLDYFKEILSMKTTKHLFKNWSSIYVKNSQVEKLN